MFRKLARLHTWGNGLKAQLGHGSLTSLKDPLEIKQVDGLSDGQVIQVGSGVTHSVAIVNKGQKGNIYIWGDNYYGQAGYIPELSVGLFDTEDDEFLDPVHLKAGLEGIDIKKISVGDYHSLCIGVDEVSGKAKLFSWGSALLGNASTLFSAKPIQLSLNNVIDILARGTNSLAIREDGSNLEFLIWGYFMNSASTIPKRLLIDTSKIRELISFDISDHNIAILYKDTSSTVQLEVYGEDVSFEQPMYPHNPVVLHRPIKNEDSEVPLLYSERIASATQIQLHGNNLFVRNENGGVSILSLKGDLIDTLSISGIQQMYIGSNSAIFSTSDAVYTFTAIEKKLKQPKSFLYRFFTRNEQVIEQDGVPLLDMIRNATPVKHSLANSKSISCGWDHFIQQ